MKCPESRHRDNPAPLGEEQHFQPAQHRWCRELLLLQPWVSSMGAWGEQMENGWKCSARVQKHRQQGVLAKPLLDLICENTSAFGKKWL